MNIKDLAKKAKAASVHLAATKTQFKDNALAQIAKALTKSAPEIIAANQKDLAAAEKNNLAAPLLKRLKFDEGKIKNVIEGIESLIQLEDPVSKTISAKELDKDLELYKISSPLGVIGIIFESRPDALVQISTLCLKSGNGVLLKGGSEAENTNNILADVISKASVSAGLPDGWLQLLQTRQDVAEMLTMDEYIDLVVPRGSNELGHADGICHIYVDADADIDMAVGITVDSKCQYVAVCNAVETLLVHEKIASQFLPKLKTALEEKGVEIRGCEKTKSVIDAEEATEDDWRTEYLDLIISVKVVEDIDSAVNHINTYGSGHTDAIVTNNKAAAAKFMDLVDSADVFWNCSTRFSDGFRYGLGAEVGISTNKIHARGPVGLEGLVIYKWKLIGNGQIVAKYSGQNAKKFTHKKLNKDCPL
jgi:glutamate-5-semialdehyde dehydrogenase